MKEKELNMGMLVKITVDYPYGTTTKVKDKIGIINLINYYEDGTVYEILLDVGDYAFHADEFKAVTESEIEAELTRLICKYYED